MIRRWARLGRVLPPGLTGLTGLACVACCAIPVLLAAGVISGAGWAVVGDWMPGVAIALGASAGLAWWALRPRPRTAAGGDECGCPPEPR